MVWFTRWPDTVSTNSLILRCHSFNAFPSHICSFVDRWIKLLRRTSLQIKLHNRSKFEEQFQHRAGGKFNYCSLIGSVCGHSCNCQLHIATSTYLRRTVTTVFINLTALVQKFRKWFWHRHCKYFAVGHKAKAIPATPCHKQSTKDKKTSDPTHTKAKEQHNRDSIYIQAFYVVFCFLTCGCLLPALLHTGHSTSVRRV